MRTNCDKHLYGAKCGICDRGPDFKILQDSVEIRYVNRAYYFNGIRWAPDEESHEYHQYEILTEPPFTEYSFVSVPANMPVF